MKIRELAKCRMTDVLQLINKHRPSGLLVDTNLLLLYLIGTTNKNRISRFKRTQTYTIEDFELLDRFMAEFKTSLASITMRAGRWLRRTVFTAWAAPTPPS